MLNDSLTDLAGLEKIKTFIGKSSKRISAAMFLSGLAVGAVLPTIDLDLESIRKGTIAGFILGLLWVGMRFKQLGSAGIEKTQKDLVVAFFYLVHFFLGVAAGQFLLRPLLELIINL